MESNKNLQDSVSDKIQKITDGKVRVEHFSDESLESWIVADSDWGDAVEVASSEYRCLHMYVQYAPIDDPGMLPDARQYIDAMAADLADHINSQIWGMDITVVDWEINTARQYVGTSLSDIIHYESGLPQSKKIKSDYRYLKISMVLRFKDRADTK